VATSPPPKTDSYSELYESDDETASGTAVKKLPPPPPKYDMKNTIPFIPPVVDGYVIKVYDGDTITIAAKLPYPNSPVYRFHVRLNGIDTPEIKGKNEDEKNAAHQGQKALESLILHKTVTLKNLQTEKYGRILADVYLKNVCLNKWMLENNYAVPYDGGTKHAPDSWTEYIKTGRKSIGKNKTVLDVVDRSKC
jgi:endonuclease YncB( thermonuclease family)